MPQYLPVPPLSLNVPLSEYVNRQVFGLKYCRAVPLAVTCFTVKVPPGKRNVSVPFAFSRSVPAAVMTP